MRGAEEEIQRSKGRVSKRESKATIYEERLGLVEEEGECRT